MKYLHVEFVCWIDARRCRNHGGSGGWRPPLFSGGSLSRASLKIIVACGECAIDNT